MSKFTPDPSFDPERRAPHISQEELEARGQLRLPFPTAAATPEKPPVHTEAGYDVLPYVVSLVGRDASIYDIAGKVRADIIARAAAGKAKYGTTLQTFNGRNAKMDLYQEVLDGIQYATQVWLENPTHYADRWRNLLVAIAEDIRGKMQ